MNVALVFFMLVVVSGIAWVLDRSIFLPRRQRFAETAVNEYARQQRNVNAADAQSENLQKVGKIRQAALARPWWLEYTAGFFPVILTVFLLRSFVVEPFKIPSGSMLPTLYVGDFILVNKFDYGIRLPIIDKKIIPIGNPQRGDVMVFRFPKDESVDFIKRVVGVPGDVVAYQNKQLTINGKPVPETADGEFLDDEREP